MGNATNTIDALSRSGKSAPFPGRPMRGSYPVRRGKAKAGSAGSIAARGPVFEEADSFTAERKAELMAEISRTRFDAAAGVMNGLVLAAALWFLGYLGFTLVSGLF